MTVAHIPMNKACYPSLYASASAASTGGVAGASPVVSMVAKVNMRKLLVDSCNELVSHTDL